MIVKHLKPGCFFIFKNFSNLFEFFIFCTSDIFSWHRLLCHTLQRSVFMGSVYGNSILFI